MVGLAAAPKLIPRDELKFPTPSGKIEIESEILKQAGLPSLPPYILKEAPTGNDFTLLFAKTATLAHGQSLNNPLLNEGLRSRYFGSTPTAPRPSASAMATR